MGAGSGGGEITARNTSVRGSDLGGVNGGMVGVELLVRLGLNNCHTQVNYSYVINALCSVLQ